MEKELAWFYYSLKNESLPTAQFSEKLNAFKYWNFNHFYFFLWWRLPHFSTITLYHLKTDLYTLPFYDEQSFISPPLITISPPFERVLPLVSVAQNIYLNLRFIFHKQEIVFNFTLWILVIPLLFASLYLIFTPFLLIAIDLFWQYSD